MNQTCITPIQDLKQSKPKPALSSYIKENSKL